MKRGTDFDRQTFAAGHKEAFAPLLTLSTIAVIPRLQAERRFGMPARAGIHPRARCKVKENLVSGPGLGPGQALSRNDDPKRRLPVDEIRTPRLYADGHSVTSPDCANQQSWLIETNGS